MTGKPTEKMVWRLQKMGYKPEEIAQMSYENASAIIGKALGNGHKEIAEPQKEFVEASNYKPKPSYNPTSQYVSYAKDVFLELRKMINTEFLANPKKMPEIADDIIMQRCCTIIDIAVKHFNK